jgi:SET domain-containing protein
MKKHELFWYTVIGVVFSTIFFILIRKLYVYESFDTVIGQTKKYTIGSSNIHGQGVICTEQIQSGENIDLALSRNPSTNEIIITPDFGQFINHKKESNTNLSLVHEDGLEVYYLVANKTINAKEEIVCNYDGEDIPSFIQGSYPHYV